MLAIRKLRCGALVTLLLSSSIAAAQSPRIILDVADAAVSRGIDERTGVTVTLTAESRSSFADFTAKYIGRFIEVRFLGQVIMKARLVTEITGGKLQIVPEANSAAPTELAHKLSAPGTKIEVGLFAE
jgi:preprotein translocase subunit SecD